MTELAGRSSIRTEGRPAEASKSTRGGDRDPGDGEVVRAVLHGDEEAYGILVRRYQDLLFRYAERMTGRPDEAADVVQVAFVKGFRNLGRCRDPEAFSGWIFRIAANQCKDHLKRRHRRDVPLDAVGPAASAGPDPEERAERAEMAGAIRAALGELSPEQREAFVLKHVEEWTYDEMAERLDASVSALKMRVHRARETLQTLLERYRDEDGVEG